MTEQVAINSFNYLDTVDIGTSIAIGLVGLLACWLAVRVFQLMKVIKKAKDIPGYWQFVSNSLFKIPIFSPYMFIGSAQHITNILREEDKKYDIQKDNNESTRILRISTPDTNFIYVWDKQSVKEVLTKTGSFIKPVDVFYEPFNIFNKNSCSILTAPDGPIWKRHHHVMAPSFSTSNLSYMSKVAIESTDALFQTKWDKLLMHNEGGFVLDLEDLTDITLEVIGKSGFGIDFGIFDEKAHDEGKKFRESLNCVIKYDYMLRLFFGKYKIIYNMLANYFGTAPALSYLSSKLEHYIEDRQREFEKDPEMPLNDLLSQLLTNDEIKSDAYILVVAGHETTTTTLQWVLYELSKNRAIQEKAREEAIRIGGGENELRPPIYEDFPSMNYIHATIMECLRIHPPIGGLTKKCIKTTTIGKYTIPKNSIMLINPFLCQEKSSEFNNGAFKGDIFHPDRFLDKDLKQQVQGNGSWIPFSMSNRKCIGFQFSQIESCMILCRMLQLYEFKLLNDESSPKEKIVNVAAITTRPSSNLRIQVERRKH